MSKFRLLLVLFLALGLWAGSLPAALEGYLKIQTLAGESADPGFLNWSKVHGFEFRHTNSAVTTGSKVAVGALHIQQTVDKVTPLLIRASVRGTHFTDAHLLLRNAGETSPVFAYNLKNVLVQNVYFGFDANADLVDEQVSLIFETMELSVSRPDASLGGTVTSESYAFTLSSTPVTSTPPVVTPAAASVTAAEDTPTSLSLSLGDDFTTVDTLALSATSSNPALIANSGLAFSGTAASSRTLTLTPVANASGAATISVTARDNAGLSTTATFLYTVNAVNDAPVVDAVAAQTTTVGLARSVTLSLSDVDNDATALSLTATSDNATVLPAGGIALSGSGASRTLTLTPAAAGSAVVTLTANDGTANSTPVTFTFIANAVGFGFPTDITLSANTVAENSGNDTVIGTLGVVDADHASGHNYALIDDAGGRFGLTGATLVVNNGALLDYEAAPTHTVTVRVTDPDGNTFSKQLTVNLTNVNEAPVVTLGPLGAAAPGRALALTQASVADPDAGVADVRVEFSVLHGSLTCDTAGALAGKVTGNASATLVITAPLTDLNAALAAGALTYTPSPGFTGEDILQFVCSDLGHTGSGGALTDTRLAAIGVAVDSFAAWQALNFSADELADPAVSGPLAVLQPDGLTNLLKYSLGLDPHVVATSSLPEMSQTATDWVFTYTRPASRPDLTYAVQFSANLAAWDLTGGTHELVTTDAANHTETWRGTLPKAAAPNLFVRLSVTRTASP